MRDPKPWLIPVLALMLSGATAALAQESGNDDWPLAEGDEPYGIVVGSVGQRAQYIYPVEIVEVDDKNISPREAVWLNPGKHTVTVRGFVTNPPGLRSASRFDLRQDESANTIELVVEEGKTYMIGLKNDPRESTQPYKVVLYRVKGDDGNSEDVDPGDVNPDDVNPDDVNPDNTGPDGN